MCFKTKLRIPFFATSSSFRDLGYFEKVHKITQIVSTLLRSKLPLTLYMYIRNPRSSKSDPFRSKSCHFRVMGWFTETSNDPRIPSALPSSVEPFTCLLPSPHFYLFLPSTIVRNVQWIAPNDPQHFHRPCVAQWLERPPGVRGGGVRSPTASLQRRKNWEVCASQLGAWH